MQTNSSGRPLEDFSTSITLEESIKGAQGFADTYDASGQYSLKGSESDLLLLDQEGSIASSQKQQILAQYQMFVGSAEAINSVGTTSAYRPMEDFSL